MERLLTVLAFVEAAALVALIALWLASAEETVSITRLGVPARASSSSGSPVHDAGVRDSGAVNAGGEVPAIATSPYTPSPGEVVAWSVDGPLGVVLCGRIGPSLGGPRGAGPGWGAAACILDDAQGRRIARVLDEGEGYAIPGLALGHYTANFRASHHREEQRELEITGAENPVRCDVRLVRKVVIRIRALTPEGAAVASLDYRLRDRIRVLISGERFSEDRLPPEFDWRPSRKLGWFLMRDRIEWPVPDFRAEHLGVVQLAGDPPLWFTLVIDRQILGAQLVASGADEVTFVVAASALVRSGVVRFHAVEAETGEPLERIDVMIGSSLYRYEREHMLGDGSILMRNVIAGAHRGWIGGEGREMKHLAFEVRIGEETDLGVIELRAARSLSGRIEDAEGRPRSGPVRAMPLDAPGGPDMPSTLVDAALDGTFSLKSLAPEHYRVVASSAGLAPSSVIVDASAGDVAGLVIRLAKVGTKVTLRANSPGGRYLEATLSDGEGPLWRGSMAPRGRVVLWLAPGSYSVDAALPGAPSRARPLVVGAQEMVMEIEP